MLTQVRQGVWSIIDADPNTATLWPFRWTFDDGDKFSPEPVPQLAQTPLLSVWPSDSTPTWFLNQLMRWPYSLQFETWYAGWQLVAPEGDAEKLIRAIFKKSARDALAAVGVRNQIVGPIGFTRVRLNKAADGPKATMGKFTIAFDLTFNPLIPATP